VGVVNEAVEDGVGIGRIADRVVPALDRDLRGQDCGGTLVAIVDDLHQVTTLLGGKPGHGPIIDDEQLDPGELGEQPGGLAVDAGEGELVEKPGEPLITHREPVTRGLVAEGASDETLAGTGRAQDQNVVVLVQPTAAGEAVDQAAVETARGAVVDILEAGGLTQPGKAQALGERGVKYDPYSRTTISTTVAGILRGSRLVESLGAGERGELILAETCFYVEGGGQISDTGRIVGDDWEFRVDDTRQPIPGLIVHIGEVLRGTMRGGEIVRAEVDAPRRLNIMRNHTATHLLHAELRAVLGEHVQQAGSLVAPDRLRFDFTHTKPVTRDELARIEAGVNAAIFENYPVQPFSLPYREAIAKGAMALFTEKYGDVVRMMEIDGISRELCGGTHVERTGQIGLFRITSESSVGSGLRRIEAVTGPRAYAELQHANSQLERIGGKLRATPDDVEDKITSLLEQLDAKDKEIARLRREGAKRQAENVDALVQRVDGVNIIAQLVDAPTMDLLREHSDHLRNKLGSGIVAVGSLINGNPNMVVAVTPDLVERGYDARKIATASASKMGGGGGGRATLAQAGGRNADKLQDALNFVSQFVAQENKK